GAQITGRGKPSDQVSQVLLLAGVKNIGLGWIRCYGVGSIELLAAFGIDVPAAPAVFERSALIGNDSATRVRHSQGAGKYRADEYAGYAQGRWSLVALQTDV